MEMLELAKIVSDKEKVIRYLQQKGILKEYPNCPYCGKGESVRLVRRDKWKCYGCRNEWGVRRGSILEGLRLPLEKVLLAVKLFELEVSARQSAKQLGVAYATMWGLYDLFRRVIWEGLKSEGGQLEGEVEMDESYFGGKRKGRRGRGAEGKVPVFGIMERGGKVVVEVVRDVSRESLLRLAIQKVKRGSLVYTDKYKGYDGLVSYGFRHERIDHGKRFGNGRVYINGIEVFWGMRRSGCCGIKGWGWKSFRCI